MAKSAQVIAEELQELLRKNALDVVTIPWPDFYKVSARQRIKVEFQNDLAAALKELGLLIVYGSSVVLIGKDYNFSRMKI